MAHIDPIPAHVLPYLDEHIHRLILINEVRDYHAILCSSCKTPVRSGWSFACLPCNYAVHNQCPEPILSRPSIWLPKSKIFDESEVKILGLTSQDVKGSCRPCLRCGEHCKGTIKSECSNGFTCHESCSLLSDEIQHPLHNHKLTLGFPNIPLRNPSFHPNEICYFCRSKLRRLSSSPVYQVYVCNLCSDFYIHIECAQHIPMFKHSAHEHPLSFLRIKHEVSYRYYDVDCNWCGRGWSEPEAMVDFGVYRCVACNFSIHESCLKYHKVIVNEDEHQHPMQYIPPKGHDRRHDEYEWCADDYCEACAKDIAQSEPIYKCLKCPNEFLFHRDCAISSSQEIEEPDVSPQQVQEHCERIAPFSANLLLIERISELMGKIESLMLNLEGNIKLLTSLKLIRKET